MTLITKGKELQFVMKKNRKIIQISILSIVFIVAVYTIGSSFKSGGTEPLIEGGMAPDFITKDLDGQAHKLSDYRGKGVIINFWGTFCKPCVREMPLIEEYYKKYQDQGIVVLGVNLDEPHVTVKSFIREYEITYPILMDDFTVRDLYGVRSYPTTFFIDSSGRIQHKFVGEMNETVYKYRLLNILPE